MGQSSPLSPLPASILSLSLLHPPSTFISTSFLMLSLTVLIYFIYTPKQIIICSPTSTKQPNKCTLSPHSFLSFPALVFPLVPLELPLLLILALLPPPPLLGILLCGRCGCPGIVPLAAFEWVKCPRMKRLVSTTMVTKMKTIERIMEWMNSQPRKKLPT